MDAIKCYNIPFNGLAAGTYRFEYEVDDAFFAAFENSEISGGRAVAVVEMTKASGALNMTVSVRGEVRVPCDRCLEDCSVKVDFESPLTVKFSDKVDAGEEDFDGEVLWLDTSVGEINIAHYIYESIVLALPYQRVHEPGGCNPDMLERFRIVTGEEFDEITAEEELKLGDNPEFGKLLELKKKLEKEEK